MTRYALHAGNPSNPSTGLWFIRDRKTDNLVRVLRQGTPVRLRSFKHKTDAQKAADKLNAEAAS